MGGFCSKGCWICFKRYLTLNPLLWEVLMKHQLLQLQLWYHLMLRYHLLLLNLQITTISSSTEEHPSSSRTIDRSLPTALSEDLVPAVDWDKLDRLDQMIVMLMKHGNDIRRAYEQRYRTEHMLYVLDRVQMDKKPPNSCWKVVYPKVQSHFLLPRIWLL